MDKNRGKGNYRLRLLNNVYIDYVVVLTDLILWFLSVNFKKKHSHNWLTFKYHE